MLPERFESGCVSVDPTLHRVRIAATHDVNVGDYIVHCGRSDRGPWAHMLRVEGQIETDVRDKKFRLGWRGQSITRGKSYWHVRDVLDYAFLPRSQDFKALQEHEERVLANEALYLAAVEEMRKVLSVVADTRTIEMIDLVRAARTLGIWPEHVEVPDYKRG